MSWTVYLARCADGTLYAGITTDAVRRIAEHNAGSGAAYTRSRRPIRLVYWETVSDRSGALRREHAMRRLTREEKEALVTELTSRLEMAGTAQPRPEARKASSGSRDAPRHPLQLPTDPPARRPARK